MELDVDRGFAGIVERSRTASGRHTTVRAADGARSDATGTTGAGADHAGCIRNASGARTTTSGHSAIGVPDSTASDATGSDHHGPGGGSLH